MNSSASIPTEPQPVRCRYPLVLLHGLFGFEKRKVGPFQVDYFRNVVPFLEQAGNEVFTVPVHPVQTIGYRARQILAYIQSHPRLKEGPINLIGHSMGGLDARCLVSELGLDKQVRCVCTIATPHHGSALADLAGHLPGLNWIARRWMPGIGDLTERSMAGWNERFPNLEHVTYACVPVYSTWRSVSPLMWPSYAYLKWRNGANDGQVATDSARWGEVIEEVNSNHIRVIGLRAPAIAASDNSHLAIYAKITQWMQAKGF